MQNNKLIYTGLVIVILAILGVGAYVIMQNQNTNSSSENYNPQKKGYIIFGIKDEADSMGSISSVALTVNKIEMHSQTQGWVTVSSATNQYDLLALKASGATDLLASANVNAGTYDQIRLMVNKVVVIQDGVEYNAKLPSGELKLVGNTVVNADTTSTAVFDFMADKSLHVTGDGKFIFTPVINLQTQSNADATVDSNGQVQVKNGHIDSNVNEGMDINGEMKVDFELDANTKIDIVNNVLKVVSQDENTVKITAGTAIKTAIDGKYIDSAVSVMLTTKNGAKEWLVSGFSGAVLTDVYINAQTGAFVSSSPHSVTQVDISSNTQSNVNLGL